MGELPQLFQTPLPVTIAAPVDASAPTVLRDPVALAVTTTSKELVPVRADRKGGVLTNVGTATVHVRFGAPATTAAGGYHLALPPNTASHLPPGSTSAINVVGTLLSASTVTLAEW